MEYNPSLTLQIVGGCYRRYVDKLTLAQLINSYRSHAKRRDAGMLSFSILAGNVGMCVVSFFRGGGSIIFDVAGRREQKVKHQ